MAALLLWCTKVEQQIRRRSNTGAGAKCNVKTLLWLLGYGANPLGYGCSAIQAVCDIRGETTSFCSLAVHGVPHEQVFKAGNPRLPFIESIDDIYTLLRRRDQSGRSATCYTHMVLQEVGPHCFTQAT